MLFNLFKVVIYSLRMPPTAGANSNFTEIGDLCHAVTLPSQAAVPRNYLPTRTGLAARLRLLSRQKDVLTTADVKKINNLSLRFTLSAFTPTLLSIPPILSNQPTTHPSASPCLPSDSQQVISTQMARFPSHPLPVTSGPSQRRQRSWKEEVTFAMGTGDFLPHLSGVATSYRPVPRTSTLQLPLRPPDLFY